MANMVEQGRTPLVPPTRLEEMGYKIVAYPLTLLSASIQAMQKVLADLKNDNHSEAMLDFSVLQEIVGFDDYHEEEKRFAFPEGQSDGLPK